MFTKKKFVVIGIWTVVSLMLPLLHSGLNADMWTRLLILLYFLILLFWYYKKGKNIIIARPRLFFVLFATLNAMVVETFHMFSRPLVPALIITPDMSFGQMLTLTSIDLALTFPAYLAIFSIIWWLLTRYHYTTLSFFIVMSLGQALGDGNAYFLANPIMLVFVPYVMLNYWAMNFIPYLMVKDHLPKPPIPTVWKANVVPLLVIPLTYICVATVLFTIGKIMGWLP